MNDKGIVNVEAEIVKDAILNFIVPLVALAVCIMLGVVFILPAYKALPDLRVQIGEKTQLRDVLVSKKTALNKLVDFKSVVDENSNLVNKVLVSEPLVPELLNQIDQIVKESGMNVSKLSYAYGGVAEDVKYQSVDVSLSNEGTYEQLITFLRNIEDAARIINISTFRYNIDSSEGIDRVAANFTLVSPYLFVESQAVTDDPVTLDISEQRFIDFINRVKIMRFYEYSADVFTIPEAVVNTTGTTIEGTEVTQPIPGTTAPATATGVQGAEDVEEEAVFAPPVIPEDAVPSTQ